MFPDSGSVNGQREDEEAGGEGEGGLACLFISPQHLSASEKGENKVHRHVETLRCPVLDTQYEG